MNKYIKIAIFTSICLICLICSYKINKLNFEIFQEDLIFFKLFEIIEENEINENYENYENIKNNQKDKYDNNNYKTKEIVFDISYKGSFFNEINLKETINPKTLVNEKIAPGTSGEFEIIIKSNQDMEYNIQFISKNTKPKNLKFTMAQSDKIYENLEDMNIDLKGSVNKKQTKKININWEWRYENSYKENQQDSLDGINIKQYNFTILAIAK